MRKVCKVCPLFRCCQELKAGEERSDETNMWLRQHAECRTRFNPQRGKHCKGGILCPVSVIPLLDLPHNSETFFFFFFKSPFQFSPFGQKVFPQKKSISFPFQTLRTLACFQVSYRGTLLRRDNLVRKLAHQAVFCYDDQVTSQSFNRRGRAGRAGGNVWGRICPKCQLPFFRVA